MTNHNHNEELSYYYGYYNGKLGYIVDRDFGKVTFKTEKVAQDYIASVKQKESK